MNNKYDLFMFQEFHGGELKVTRLSSYYLPRVDDEFEVRSSTNKLEDVRYFKVNKVQCFFNPIENNGNELTGGNLHRIWVQEISPKYDSMQISEAIDKSRS